MLIIWKWWESKAVPVPPQGSDAEAPWFIRHTVRVLGVAPTRTPVHRRPSLCTHGDEAPWGQIPSGLFSCHEALHRG